MFIVYSLVRRLFLLVSCFSGILFVVAVAPNETWKLVPNGWISFAEQSLRRPPLHRRGFSQFATVS